MKVHVLQHASFEGLGNMETWLRERGAQISFSRLYESPVLPGIPYHYSVRIDFPRPGENMGPGSPLGGSPPLDTNIRQRLEYSRRAFQAGDRSRAFEGGYQCGCGRGCARGSETAPPKMPRDNLGRINKSARYPFGQLSVERGQLIRQILH